MKKAFNHLTSHHLTNKSGVALIAAILVITMVSILLTSYVAVTVSERKRVEHESAAASAEYLAKVGLERAFMDLSCEFDKDESWIDGGVTNRINMINAFVPVVGSGSEDPGNRSDYQDFYLNIPFPLAASVDTYAVQIAFVNNTDDSAFLPGRLWVRSTGTVAATGDSVTLTQLAKVKPVKNVTLGVLYDSLDYNSGPGSPDSAVDFAASQSAPNEIRIADATLDQDVTIAIGNISGDANPDLIIRGGYGYDFSDGSRNTAANKSVLKDTVAPGAPVVTITGAGTVLIGGVEIE